MIDLPSREEAKAWADRYADVVSPRSMVNVVAAFGDGQLVGWEAIDWEAAIDASRDRLSKTEVRRVVAAALRTSPMSDKRCEDGRGTPNG